MLYKSVLIIWLDKLIYIYIGVCVCVCVCVCLCVCVCVCVCVCAFFVSKGNPFLLLSYSSFSRIIWILNTALDKKETKINVVFYHFFTTTSIMIRPKQCVV